MTAEAFLARLYTDAELRARFLADPVGEARRAGLDEETAERLAAIDRHGLELAAASFAAKRARSRPVVRLRLMSGLRIVAAVFMVIAGIALFVTDEPKYFALPLIIGNLLVLIDVRRQRREEP